MGILRRLPKRLWGDRRGNVAMITAIALPVLALVAGGGIDFVRAASMKAYVQDATDAAVLAAAKSYYSNTSLAAAARKSAAQAAADSNFNASMASYKQTMLNKTSLVDVDTNTGEIKMTVTGASGNIFSGILGFATFPFTVTAHAAAGGKDVEVVLVLDNTSSMFDSGRFSVMREAAKQYVNDVYDLGGERVKVSVVPWTTVVNIKSEAVASPDASAAAVGTVPAAGSRRQPVAPAFDRIGVLASPRSATTAITQAQLDDYAKPTKWRGCIRSANNEVKVDASGNVTQAITDAAPATRWPAALLEPTVTTSLKTWCTAWTTTSYTCSTGGGGGGGGGGGTTPSPQGSLDPKHRGGPDTQLAGFSPMPGAKRTLAEQGLLQPAATCTSTTCNSGKSFTSTTLYNCLGSGSTSWHANGTKNAYFDSTQACSSTGYYTATGLVQANPGNVACVSDPNEIAYLAGGGKICRWEQDAFTGFNTSTWTATPNWTAQVPISGPNLNCPVSILPLSQNRKQVLDKLNEMYPVPGGTMADVGILWGLRTLSPQSYWTSFWGLSGDAAPTAWNSKDTAKIMIVLTDGFNVAPSQYEGYYGCTDTGRGGKAGNCWKSPNLGVLNATAVNNLTKSACGQLRNTYKVDLYFILVDVTDTNAQALASACAPEAGHAISTSTSQLGDVFKGLVSRSLRLTK